MFHSLENSQFFSFPLLVKNLFNLWSVISPDIWGKRGLFPREGIRSSARPWSCNDPFKLFCIKVGGPGFVPCIHRWMWVICGKGSWLWMRLFSSTESNPRGKLIWAIRWQHSCSWSSVPQSSTHTTSVHTGTCEYEPWSQGRILSDCWAPYKPSHISAVACEMSQKWLHGISFIWNLIISCYCLRHPLEW